MQEPHTCAGMSSTMAGRSSFQNVVRTVVAAIASPQRGQRDGAGASDPSLMLPLTACLFTPSSVAARRRRSSVRRSEEHTSELQSHHDLVCRLLLEKKKKN